MPGAGGLLGSVPPLQIVPNLPQLPVQLLDRGAGGRQQLLIGQLSGRRLLPGRRRGFGRPVQAVLALGQFSGGLVRGPGCGLRRLGGRP